MKVIQHISFNCSDVKSQEKFYTKHFGFCRACVFKAGTDEEFIMLRLGNTCLELCPAQTQQKSLKATEQPVGFKHLAFDVPDLDAAIAALHADGIETDKIIDLSSILEGFRICFFHDPDGNRIELMEGYRDDILNRVV